MGHTSKSKMSVFPKYFAVKRSKGFKVYENTVVTQTGVTVNDLTRGHDMTIIYVTKLKSHETIVNTTLVMSHKRQEPYTCTWTHSGIDLNIRVGSNIDLVQVPVLNFNGEVSDILPHAADYLVYTNPKYVDEFARPKYPEAPVSTAAIPVAPVVKEVTIPRHVKVLIVADALRRNEMCSVMLEPITKENAAVTNCGHVFSLTGINTWLSSSLSKGTCPMCKQCCHVV
jgi:hypothetical protein